MNHYKASLVLFSSTLILSATGAGQPLDQGELRKQLKTIAMNCVKGDNKACIGLAKVNYALQDYESGNEFSAIACKRKSKEACGLHRTYSDKIAQMREHAGLEQRRQEMRRSQMQQIESQIQTSKQQMETHDAILRSTQNLASGTDGEGLHPMRAPANTTFGQSGCGVKPIPAVGHRIGNCVNGNWEQISTASSLHCGIKPIPSNGYKVGNCVNGEWQQTSENKALHCGIKPIPNVGCRIGDCIGGSWQQVCD